MAKRLDKTRPRSTIADMIDGDLIQQATQPPPEVIPEAAEAAPVVVEVAPKEITAVATPPLPSTPSPIPGAGAGAGEVVRTGEHSDIQKTYRLTPTTAGVVQGLSRCFGEHLTFEASNSVVIRSILRVVHEAQADIHQLAGERLTPRRQPSTAIGSEHLRDALESELAGIILDGIQACAENQSKD